jgi:hypothetical protein
MDKTYAQVISKTAQTTSEPQKIVPQTPQEKCLYDEICYKGKLCGDCAANEYQMNMYYTYCENFKFDRQMNIKYNKDE